ncbi:Protein FAR1-RELATED SEQUENCE 11, partial [Mucuna pruriens]
MICCLEYELELIIMKIQFSLVTFLSFVKGKYPQIILSYQDLALEEAITKELSNTKHAFLSSWISFSLGSRYNDFKCEFHRLYHLECVDNFECEWNLMVSQFDLSMDCHIDLFYIHRQFWTLTYLKDFFVGTTTTTHSKSINSYIKRFFYVKTSLTGFVNQVGGVVKIRNQGREEARMRQKYHNPQIKKGFLIEEHASTILTPYVFELLQCDILLFAKYGTTETGNGSYIVCHHTKPDGGHLNQFNVLAKIEFSRILCKHVIRVVMVKNYFSFLPKYIPFFMEMRKSIDPSI